MPRISWTLACLILHNLLWYMKGDHDVRWLAIGQGQVLPQGSTPCGGVGTSGSEGNRANAAERRAGIFKKGPLKNHIAELNLCT